MELAFTPLVMLLGRPIKPFVLGSFAVVCVALAGLLLAACGGGNDRDNTDLEQAALHLIADKIEPNDLGVLATTLEAETNRFGEGIFVYTRATSADNDALFAAWLVVDETAYPLGIPAKLATPSLPCPCNAPRGFWDKAGLNPFQSSVDFERLVLGASN